MWNIIKKYRNQVNKLIKITKDNIFCNLIKQNCHISKRRKEQEDKQKNWIQGEVPQSGIMSSELFITLLKYLSNQEI